MRKRIALLVTALVMALMMSFGGMAFAKQAQTFEKGQTTTHQGNSEHSPVVSSVPKMAMPLGISGSSI